MNGTKKTNGTKKRNGAKKVFGYHINDVIKDDVILNELNMTSAKKLRQI